MHGLPRTTYRSVSLGQRTLNLYRNCHSTDLFQVGASIGSGVLVPTHRPVCSVAAYSADIPDDPSDARSWSAFAGHRGHRLAELRIDNETRARDAQMRVYKCQNCETGGPHGSREQRENPLVATLIRSYTDLVLCGGSFLPCTQNLSCGGTLFRTTYQVHAFFSRPLTLTESMDYRVPSQSEGNE